MRKRLAVDDCPQTPSTPDGAMGARRSNGTAQPRITRLADALAYGTVSEGEWVSACVPIDFARTRALSRHPLCPRIWKRISDSGP